MFQLLGEAVADAAKAHKAARVGIAFVDGAASLDSDLQVTHAQGSNIVHIGQGLVCFLPDGSWRDQLAAVHP